MPINLGILMSSEMVPDEKVFYCPSGGDAHRRDDARGMKNNDTLGDWKAARTGMGAATAGRVLSFGNWPRKSTTGEGPNGSKGWGVSASYGYRNAGVAANTSQLAADVEYIVAYTNPRIKSRISCPPFKTSKLLAGRAFVSDDFWKGGWGGYGVGNRSEQMYSAVAEPGWGAQFHREGYNVLHGDYSANWFGDPEQRIIFWDTSKLCNYEPADGALGCTSQQYGVYNQAPTAGGYATDNPTYGTPLVWHTFDIAQGVDARATSGR